MSKLRNKQLINIRAEFNDEQLEDLYYEKQITTFKHSIRHIMLVIGIVYLALAILDFSTYSSALFLQLLAVRLVVFFFALISWFTIRKNPTVKVTCSCITFFPPVLCFCSILIAALTKNQQFAYQAMIVMVIIFCTTLMPNRWINLMFINILMAVGFLAIVPTYIKNIATYDYLIVLLFLVATLVFAIAAQYRSNLNQREKFLREKQLETQSVTDTLTGLYNRLWFDLTLNDWCANTEKDQVFSLVITDIDNFKVVNDTYGHPTGDRVLIQCTKLLQASVRSTDLLARWGGEEFVLLLPGANLEKAVELSERMRAQIESHTFEEVGKLTCSFGVVMHTPDQSAESLLQEADKQLYIAKESGKNRVVYPS